MSYLQSDGSIRRELVPAETLFNVDAMTTLKMKPVTDTHPAERAVDRKTVKRRKVGFTGETVKQDGDFLTTSLTVTDDDAINNIDNGRQELSPGYICSLLMEPGTYNGEHYDAIQIKRKYNHVAVCDKARGGNDLRLNFDSVEHLDGFEFIDHKVKPSPKPKESSMPNYRIDGIDYEAAQEVINFIGKLNTKVDEQSGKIDQSAADLKTVTDERDELKKKVDEFEKTDNSKAINDGVTARLAVLKVAEKVLDEDDLKDVEKIDNAELRKKVILKKSPDAKLDEKSEDYINARFDAIAEDVAKDDGEEHDDDAIGRQRQKSTPKNDGKNGDVVADARKRYEDSLKNDWKDEPEKKDK